MASRYSIPLAAGAELKVPYAGQVMQIVTTGTATAVTLSVHWRDKADREEMGSVTNRFKVGPGRQFSGLTFLASINTTLEILVADSDVGFPTASEITLDPSQFPLPVDGRSADDLAAVASYPGAVAITSANLQVMAADTDARRVVMHNAGANAIAVYRVTGTTFANAAVRLAAGDTVIEERFAGTNQAWFARCDAGLASTLVIEVTK
jgi:hypothetical protein